MHPYKKEKQVMGMKYCPKCRAVVLTKALQDYSQIVVNGVPGKRRKIVHLEEDGGCGHSWYTVELLEEVLDKN